MQNKSIKADFFPFSFHSTESSIDILRKTKITIKSTFKYSDYMKKYTNYVNNIKALDKLYALPNKHQSLRLPSLDFVNPKLNTISNFKIRNKTNTRTRMLDIIKNPINIFEFYFDNFENILSSDKLVYDLPYILNKDYEMIIKNKIDKLKLKKTDNTTNSLNKKLNDIEISLNSLQIELINKSDPSKEIILYNLPLSLLPIFYYIDIHDFKLLLTRILKFENDEKFMYFNDDELFKLLRSSKLFTDRRIEFPKNKIYKFHWITSRYLFDVYIKLPSAEIKINNQVMKKFPDTELILFMLEENFLNWEFYTFSYLISFKEIRNFLDLGSKKKPINTFNNLKEDIRYYNYKEKSYSYLFTNSDGNNFLYKLKAPILEVKIPIYELKYIFQLNLKQMGILSKSTDIDNLAIFFKKILFLNKKSNMQLDYDRLESVTPTLLKFIKFERRNEKDEKIKSNWEINIQNPIVQIYNFDDYEIKSKTFSIDKNCLNLINSNDIKDWIEVIFKNNLIANFNEISPQPTPIAKEARNSIVFNDNEKIKEFKTRNEIKRNSIIHNFRNKI